MCERVQLLVQRDTTNVEVRRQENVTIVVMSDGTDVDNLRPNIEGRLDSEQLSCVISLWGDDDYGRFFRHVKDGIVISCTSIV